jgi:hypothetical protein
LQSTFGPGRGRNFLAGESSSCSGFLPKARKSRKKETTTTAMGSKDMEKGDAGALYRATGGEYSTPLKDPEDTISHRWHSLTCIDHEALLGTGKLIRNFNQQFATRFTRC